MALYNYNDEEEKRRKRQQAYLDQWQSQQDQMQQSQNDSLAEVKRLRERVTAGLQNGTYDGPTAPTTPTTGPTTDGAMTYDHALANVQKMRKKLQTDSTYDATVAQNMEPVVYNTWRYPLSEEAKRNFDLRDGLGLQDQTTPEKRDTISTYIDGLPDEAKKLLQDYTDGYLQSISGGGSVGEMRRSQRQGGEKMIAARQALKDQLGLDDEALSNLVAYQEYLANYQDNERRKEDMAQELNTGNPIRDAARALNMSKNAILGAPIAGFTAAASQIANPHPELGPDTYNPGYGLSNYAQNVQQAVQNRINPEGDEGSLGRKALSNIYGWTYSAAESAYGMAAAAGLGLSPVKGGSKVANLAKNVVSLLPMGANAYAGTLQAAQERGITGDAAQMTAAVAGAAEVVTEIASLDKVWDAVKANRRTARKMLVDWGVGSLIEGTEEAASDIINRIADGIINGDTPEGRSEYAQNVQNYMAQGMSEDDAKKQASKDWWANLGLSFLGGLVSGAESMGLATGANYIRSNAIANEMYGNANYRQLATEAEQNAPSTWENDSAKESWQSYMARLNELANRQENGEKITQRDRRNLYWDLEDAANTEYETREESGTNERMRQEAAQREEEARKAAEEEEKNRITFEQYDDGIEITDADGNPIQQEQPAAPARPWAQEENRQSTPYQQEALGRDEITKRLAEAQSPTELATVYQQVQDSGNTEDIDYLKQIFPTYTSRMVSEIEDEGERIQSLDVINRMAIDGTLTQQRAYQAGLEGREINPDEMSDEIKLAYNEGQIANREAAAAETRAFRETVESMRMPAMQDSFIAHYNGDMPVQQYNRVFSNIFEAGRQIDTENQTPEQIAEKLEKTIHNSGTAISLMAYTDMDGNEYSGPQVAEQIFNDAIKAARQDRADVLLREKAKTITAKGTGEFQDLRRNPSSRQDLRPLNGIAKLTGISIKVMDRADFIKTSGGADANGFFNQKTGELILNGDSGRIVTTALHEIGEFADAFNTNEFRSVVQATQSTLQDVLGLENYRALRSPYLNGYTINADGSTVSYNTFTESDVDKEITNDVIWRILGNEDLLTALGNNLDHQVENGKLSDQQARTIRQKISDFIRKVFDGLKNLVSGGGRKPVAESLQGTYGKLTTAGETKMSGFQSAAANIEELEQHRDALISAIKGAAAKYQSITDIQFSKNVDRIMNEGIDLRYSKKVTDQETLDFLEDQDHITTYRSFQIIDGGLYAPMAAEDYTYDENGKKKKKLGYRSELGQWEQATEAIDVARANFAKGKRKVDKNTGIEYAQFDLEGGDNQTGGVAYNPYLHSSNVVLNDQFAAAYRRKLVVVECVVPASEKNSGYHAELAKDPTGWREWKSGTVAGKIAKQKPGFERQVFLSRWMKPVRILSDAEVASMYKDYLDGTKGIKVPWNVVTPSLREELVKKGIEIDYGYNSQVKASFADKFPDEAARFSKQVDSTITPEEIDGLYDEYEYIGIRVQEEPFTQGETMTHVSHRWDDGTDTGEELDGVSAVDIGHKSADYQKRIDNALKRYYGNNAAILVSNYRENGEDENEIIMRDPTVYKILRDDTRYSKQVDSDGNKLTEAQAEYFKGSQARDDNGNLMVMYHGTKSGGFTVFDKKKLRSYDDGVKSGFFFTDSRRTASTYSLSNEDFIPDQEYTEEELGDIIYHATFGEWELSTDDGVSLVNLDDEEIRFDSLKDAQAYFIDNLLDPGPVNYKVYLDLKNPLIIDTNGSDWDAIEYKGQKRQTDMIAIMARNEGHDGVIFKNVYDGPEMSTVAVTFESNQAKSVENKNPTTNPDIRYSKKVDISADEIDEIIRLATNYNPDYWLMEYGDYELHTPNGTKHFDTIKDLQKYIVKNIGATSIGDLQSNRVESYDLLSHLLEKENTGWNIWETPDGYEITQPNGDVTTHSTLAQAQKYIMSHAAQINPKYANAQTSSGAEDSQGNELSRKQEKYFKNSKVRDENGKLLVMYHGTTEVGFTVFDPQYSRDNLSLFFTDSPEVAASYSASTEDFIPDKVYSFEEMASIVDRTTEGDYELTQARNGSYDMRPVDGGETHHFETLPDVMDFIVNQYMDGAGNYNVYLNLENPMIINWEELSEAEKQEMASDGHVQLTRDYAKIAKDKGYDGVIFKNIVDIGLYSDIDKPSTVAVAFKSNQVKSVANKNPTDNPDIRYSRRIAEEVSEDELLEAINRSGGRGDYFAYHSGYGKYLLEYYDEDGNQQSKWFTTRKEAYDFVGREITPFTFDQLDGFSGKVTADTLNEIMVSETYGHGWVEETFNNRIVVFMDDNRYEFRSAEDAAKYLADNKDAIRAAAIPTDANGVPIIDTEGQTLSPGQQEFFRDSKVRDAQGALITMYKGAGNAGYTVFSRDRSEYGVGWFFTSSKGVAYGYAPNSEEFIPEEMDEELRGIDVSEWELSEPGDYDDYDPESGYSQSQNYVVRTPSRDYEFKTRQAAVNFIRDAAAGYRPGIYKVYLNIKNPLIVDAEFNDWRAIPFEGNNMSTDQIADVAKERGYDGMIIKNVEDTTASAYERYSTVAQAFEQNQIKSVANRNPTDDPDIRKSVDLSGLDDFEDGSIESIYRDQELASILRQGSEALKGQKVDSRLVNKIAGEILKKYKSAYDRKTLADNLEKLFAYAQEKNRIDYEDLSKVIREVARPVVDGVTEKVGTKEYKAFMDILRSRKIALTDRQKAEVASHSGSYGAFVKSMRGISFSSNGTPLDSMWSELVDASGGFLDPDAAEGDMPILLQQAMHDLTPYAANTFQGDADDVAANLAMEIIERYYEEAGKAQSDATLKQKLKEASDKMKKEAEEFRQTVRREYEERLKEARKEQKERSDRKRREGKYTQKDMDEAIAKMRARNKRQYEKQKEAEQQRYQKQQVMNAANKLLNMLINPTPKAHVPEALQEPVLDLLTSINFLTPTITRTKDGKYQTKILVTEKDETGKVKRRWETFIADNVADVIGAFQESLENTANGSKDQRKWNEKLRGVKDLYSQAVTPNSELSFTLRDFLEGLDQSLAADLDAIIANRNGAVAISMLNAEELKTINKVLRNIMASINKIDKLYSDPESINGVHGLAEQTMAHANSLLKNRKTKDRRRATRGAKTFLTLDNATPETFMHAIGESGERIYGMLTKAQNTKAFDLRHAQEYMIGDGSTDKEGRYNSGILKGVSQKELSEWSGDKAKIVYDGGNMKLTVADLMYLYELQKRKDAESHKYGGFEAADKIINGKVHQDTTPHYMSSETISEITDLLTERQKEIADDIQKFLAVECSAWGNDVSTLLYGYEKFTDPNYIPMSVDKRTTRISNEQVGEGLINTIKNQGFTKALIPNASNPLIIMDIFDVFTNHVTGMAAYHAYAAPITDIIRWDNFKAIDEVEGFDGEKYGRYNTVKESLQTIFGDDGQRYLVRLVQDLNNQEKRTEVGASRIQWLMGNYKSAATLANLRVVMQQPTAWLRAGEVIDYKWLAEGLKPNAAAADLQERTSAISWVKSQGNIDGYITQSMKATITGAKTWRDRINGAAGYLAGKADDVTWAALYRAVYAEQKAAHDGKANTVDFELAVNRRFDELIARTQVVDGTLMRSQMMRSKDGLNTTLSAFMAEPTKSYNMFLRDYFDIAQGRDKTGKVRKEDLKHLSRTLVAFLLTNIVNAVAQSLADAARDEKEDKDYWDKFLEAYTENLLDDLNMLHNIPVVKNLTATIEAGIKRAWFNETPYNSGTDDMLFGGLSTLLQSIGAAAQHTEKSKKTPYGVSAEIIKGISQVFGVPAYNLMRDVVAIYNTVNDFWGGKNIRRSKATNDELTGPAMEPIEKSIRTGSDFKAAIEKAVSKGATYDKIETAVTNAYKAEYIDLMDQGKKSEATKLENRLVAIYQYLDKKENQKTVTSNKRIRKWYEDELEKRKENK